MGTQITVIQSGPTLFSDKGKDFLYSTCQSNLAVLWISSLHIKTLSCVSRYDLMSFRINVLFFCNKNNRKISMAYKHLFYYAVHVVWLIQAGLVWAGLNSSLLVDFRSLSLLPKTCFSHGKSQECKRESSDVMAHRSCVYNWPTITSTHIHLAKANCHEGNRSIFSIHIRGTANSYAEGLYL